MMEQAQQYLDSGQYAEAEAIYRSVLAEDATNTQAVFMLALTRRSQGDLDEALDLMVTASEQDPENAHVHYTLGTLYMSKKSTDDARAAYLRALQADPFHIDAHNGVAFVELVSGNFSAAERAANLALTEDAQNVQALVYLGTAKLEQKDTTKAIAYLQEALKESPGHQSAQIQLGRAFLAAGNNAFAVQCFQNVVEADERFAAGWEQLGMAQAANGNEHDAARSFQQALSLGRNSPAVVEALEKYRKAFSGGQAGQNQDVAGRSPSSDMETLLTRAEYEIARGNPSAVLEILSGTELPVSDRASLLKATAFEQMRNHDAALAIIEPIAKTDQAPDEARLAYARLLAKAGREEEADQWIGTLLSADEPPLFAQIFRGIRQCSLGDEDGIGALQKLEDEPELSGVDQRRIHKTLAETLDRAGRFEEAAAYYSKLSGRLAQVLAVAETSALANREYLDAGESPAPGNRLDSASLPADPVFIFGWPGSGWEWLAAGLGSHDDVMLVADKPETQARRRSLITAPAGRSELDGLASGAAGHAAGQYWNDLKSGQLEPGPRVTLDAMWISAHMLPTISRLFPAARIIVVQRDPRDMVLDWFRTGYDDLAGLAASYKEQMEALQQYRGLLDIEFIDVNGDALFADALPELQKLTASMNLPWDDGVSKHMQERLPAVDEKRGSWPDYSAVLEEPLQIFDIETKNQET